MDKKRIFWQTLAHQRLEEAEPQSCVIQHVKTCQICPSHSVFEERRFRETSGILGRVRGPAAALELNYLPL